MDFSTYKTYFAHHYEQKIMNMVKTIKVSSIIEYDASNCFVFTRMPRDVAFTCKSIMRRDQWLVRYQIFKNLQAGKFNDYCP